MSATDPMRGWIDGFPEMLEAACAAPLPAGFGVGRARTVLIGGMGGSGMAGALSASLLQRRGLRVQAWRDPELPGWLSPEDCVVAVSYSGETWETAAMLDGAIARGVPVVSIASGGSLAARSESSGIPFFPVPAGMAPRAALPWLLGGVLRAIGVTEAGEFASAIRLLRAERDCAPAGRVPFEIASSLEGRIACLVSVGSAMETVAIRWRSQILENAEQFAIVSPLPEMAHNEVMGWGFLREVGLSLCCRVLAESGIPAPLGRVLAALECEAQRSGHSFETIPSPEGEGLAPLLAQVYLGDRVSMELADRKGVAATPVEAISRMRAMAGKEPNR